MAGTRAEREIGGAPECMLCAASTADLTAHTLTCNAAQSERNSLQTSLGECKRALAAARETHERHLLEHQAELKSSEAAAAEARTREVAELRDAAARCDEEFVVSA